VVGPCVAVPELEHAASVTAIAVIVSASTSRRGRLLALV
jgi:hypothetical protein